MDQLIPIRIASGSSTLSAHDLEYSRPDLKVELKDDLVWASVLPEVSSSGELVDEMVGIANVVLHYNDGAVRFSEFPVRILAGTIVISVDGDTVAEKKAAA
ncbi:MAG: hypothetical protein KDD42_00195 [Bdellovibrionales bacterium]|nr:hypothetical protein [Bdellovibrionales bacterium]